MLTPCDSVVNTSHQPNWFCDPPAPGHRARRLALHYSSPLSVHIITLFILLSLKLKSKRIFNNHRLITSTTSRPCHTKLLSSTYGPTSKKIHYLEERSDRDLCPEHYVDVRGTRNRFWRNSWMKCHTCMHPEPEKNLRECCVALL